MFDTNSQKSVPYYIYHIKSQCRGLLRISYPPAVSRETYRQTGQSDIYIYIYIYIISQTYIYIYI
jgi:hypothetical protein